MSWSDDIRCLYCDGRLPLYRKITQGQFCSSAHRKEYWKEQERLAVERLHQTHNSLRAYAPPAPLEPVEVVLNEGLLPSFVQPAAPAIPATATALVRNAQPLVPEMPATSPEPVIHDQNDDHIPLLGVLGQEFRLDPWIGQTGIAMLEVEPYETTVSIVRPALGQDRLDVPGLGTSALHALTMRSAGALEPAKPCVIDIEPIPGLLEPVCTIALKASTDWPLTEWPDSGRPEAQVEPAPVEHDTAPAFAPLRPIRFFEPASDSVSRVRVFTLWPIATPAHGASFGAMTVPVQTSQDNAPGLAGMQRLSVEHAARVHGTWLSGIHAVDFRPEHEASRVKRGAPPAMSHALRMARGTEYSVRPVDWDTTPLVTEPVEFPIRTKTVLPVHNATIAVDELVDPPIAGLMRLGLGAAAVELEFVRPGGILSSPQPVHIKPLIPASKLEPLDEKPIADLVQPEPAAAPIETAPAAMPPPPQKRAHVWTHAAGFWKNAPRDLKILLFTIPALIALAFQPALPKISVSSGPATSGFRQVISTQMSNFRKSMVERAAIALDEDFRSGLDYWRSRESNAAEWSYDATGFVKPAALAIYEPTATLTDYQLQFLGMIDQKAMSWVVRAADFDNFYVIKLAVVKPGPVPEIGITRYAVVKGRAVDRVDTPVRIDARSDTLYRVRMDVKGDDFTLYVQGQLMDSWTEPRLRRGGVGFFNARGEESRMRWMQVTHQYDMLGRLCAYLAP